jgi:capsular polysaccharide biosynthesis protein
MNSNQNETMDKVKEEFDLLSFMKSVWKHKIMIVCFMIVTLLLASVYSLFFAPTYHTAYLNISFKIPVNYNTKYGDFPLIVQDKTKVENSNSILNVDNGINYINLIKNDDVLTMVMQDLQLNGIQISLEELNAKINIELPIAFMAKNTFKVSVTDHNPERALSIAESIYNKFLGYLDVTLKDKAIEFYLYDYEIINDKIESEIVKHQDMVKELENLLLETPQLLSGDENKVEQANSGIIIVHNDRINPAYSRLSEDIMSKKEMILEMKQQLTINNQNLQELEADKNAISDYQNNNYNGKLVTNLKSLVENNVTLLTQPAVSATTVPNHEKNIVIGGVSGFMLGLLLALANDFIIVGIKSKIKER